ncbi:MAG: VPLPA-CTERM sorting domain-containing protein [Pseudomonadota bacterium]
MKTVIASLVLAFAASSASAIVVTPGSTAALLANEEYTGGGSISPGGSLEFGFDVPDGIKVSDISFTGVGFNNGTDLNDIMFGIDTASTGYSTVIPLGTTAVAFGTLAGFTASNDFSIVFSDGIVSDATVGFAFTTSTVPLPAAGGLLATALLGAGFVARRRRKAEVAA